MATTGITQLRNSTFQNASDCSALVSILSETKAVFIANRTDGKSGSGYFFDPYDGSTASKLDTVLRDASKCPSYCQIYLRGDLFLTNGFQDFTPNKGFIWRKGWQVRGLGRDITTIRLMSLTDKSAGAPAQGYVFQTSTDIDGSDSVLQDLTIDCNRTNLSAGTAGGTQYATGGAWIRGSNVLFNNVHFIKSGGNLAGTIKGLTAVVSSWTVAGVWQNARNSGITNCLCDQGQGDYGGCFSVLSGGTPWKTSGCFIRNNRISDWSSATGAIEIMGEDLSVEGNEMSDSSSPFVFIKDGIINGLSVSRNKVINTSAGGFINAPFTGTSLSNVSIEDNLFSYVGAQTFAKFTDASATYKITRVRIRGNTTTNLGTVTTYADKGIPLNLSYIDGLESYDNDWGAPSSFQSSASISNCRNLSLS